LKKLRYQVDATPENFILERCSSEVINGTGKQIPLKGGANIIHTLLPPPAKGSNKHCGQLLAGAVNKGFTFAFLIKTPMTLFEFLPLDKAARKEVVLSTGVYITSRIRGSYTYLLFSVENFYVELVYHKDSERFEGLIVFSNRSQRLEPYLAQLTLENLFAEMNLSQ
jgi:hypothetical protein